MGSIESELAWKYVSLSLATALIYSTFIEWQIIGLVLDCYLKAVVE